ncbi:polysaccharide deacetylase family protein [Haliea sp. E1-2-M8]|uniref:polysaccharide deacetylase family protein n=1 Tax=Haliea sp. E1-2-M8 TaxID=3064706 RepID=UPI00271C94C2|nr:polysaccharide deacetylase family protein [Haliea sp. E1-2-M8]MDO8860428.1 polysaccharide deacetylase family protein [Haliea sp. E1-2-M8]
MSRLFHWSGLNALSPLGESGQYVRILAYHRIVDDHADFPFDEDLVSASRDEFDKQLRFVKANFTVVPLGELDAAIQQDKPDERLCVLTFDDGFDDFYSNAFPLLKAHDLPATLFVATDLIGSKEIIWFDWVVKMLKENQGRLLSVNNGEFHEVVAKDTPRRMLDYLKAVPDHTRIETIGAIERAFGCAQPADGHPGSRMMTWPMLQEMSLDGMEIGSHTCSHPLLRRLDHDSLMHELLESKRCIERNLHVECRSFAYPVGGSSGFSRELMKSVADAGYLYACDYRGGVNYRHKLDRYALRRIHVERYVDYPYFCSRLCYPKLFSYFR